MSGNINKGALKDYLFIILGTTILALAINVFYTPNEIVVGGVTGLGIIVSEYSKMIWGFEVPLSLTNIVINVPLFFIAYKVMGKGFIGRTAFATIYLSVALVYTDFLPVYTGDLALVAVYGGVMAGSGIGFVFRGIATTGGTDLAATIIHKYFKHISVSHLLFAMDAIIIAIGFFVFGSEKAMYATIAVYISSKCIATILDGMSFSKAAFIISDNAEEIANEIFKSVDRGVTALHGKGMYTGTEKYVLLCVFSQKEITRVKETVKRIDKDAFLLVTDVKEVLGQGFQSMN